MIVGPLKLFIIPKYGNTLTKDPGKVNLSQMMTWVVTGRFIRMSALRFDDRVAIVTGKLRFLLIPQGLRQSEHWSMPESFWSVAWHCIRLLPWHAVTVLGAYSAGVMCDMYSSFRGG